MGYPHNGYSHEYGDGYERIFIHQDKVQRSYYPYLTAPLTSLKVTKFINDLNTSLKEKYK